MQGDNKEGTVEISKVVADYKQNVSIRKITVQALAPVIARVEEHIAYIIEETSMLRGQNATLQSTQAKQQYLEQQILTLNLTLDKLQNKVDSFNQDKQSKIIDHSNQMLEMNEKLDRLFRQTAKQGVSIEEISNKNQQYLEQIQMNKQDQRDAIEVLRSNIENYYEQQIGKITNFGDEVEVLKNKVKLIEEQRKQEKHQHQKVANLASLYDSQRQDSRRLMDRVAALESNAILSSDYEQDMKYMKVQVEMAKTSVREMIDQSLTPEIRKFLPVLINKLGELNAFESRLGQLRGELKNHSDRMVKIQIELQDKLAKHVAVDLRTTIDNQFQTLAKHTNESVITKLKQLQQNIKYTSELTLQQKLKQLQQKTINYLNSNSFIESKKDQIYSVVQRMRPKQQKDEQNRIFQMVYSVEPMVEAVKKQIQISRADLKEAKDTIDGKINQFHNQIIKIKSDVSIEAKQNKKILDSFNKKLLLHDTVNRDLSQLIAKLIESVMLAYALQIEPQQKEKEIYVTYNDGLIFQIEGKSVRYRRKEMNKGVIRRAVLQEFVKVIDRVVLSQPHLGWLQSQLKPSHFFTAVHSNYLALQESSLASPKKQIIGSLEKPSPETFISTQLNMPKITPSRSKVSSQRQSMSKTIDFQGESKDSPLTTRYEHEQHVTANRRSVRLKKLDRKQI